MITCRKTIGLLPFLVVKAIIHFPEFEDAVKRSRAPIPEVNQEFPVVLRQSNVMLGLKFLHGRLRQGGVQFEPMRFGAENLRPASGRAQSLQAITNSVERTTHFKPLLIPLAAAESFPDTLDLQAFFPSFSAGSELEARSRSFLAGAAFIVNLTGAVATPAHPTDF